MSEALDARFEREKGRTRVTAQSVEIDRIIELPVMLPPSPQECEEFSRLEIDARHFEEGFRLLSTQAASVMSYDLFGGLFAPVGVGWGKTLITLMIASRAYQSGIEKSILMVPPQVYAQLTRIDIPWARARVDLNLPFMLMGGKSQDERRGLARSGKKGCYVLPYSCLSTKDSTEILNWISPGLLILDEAHALKSRKSARTKRVLDFIERKQPRICALSGTITSKSIKDYHHLIVHALRELSPLPSAGVMADQWALVLDAEADPSDAHLGPITPLLRWAERNFPDAPLPPHVAGFRQAFRQRLVTAPGVVATGDAEIGVSLAINNQPIENWQSRPGAELLEQKIKDVDELWLTPSGDNIEWGMHKWKYLWELNSGFYYKLQWPSPEEIAARRLMTLPEAEAFLLMAQQAHLARQGYNRALSRWLDDHFIHGLDTPMLVGLEMHNHGPKRVGDDLYKLWREAKDLEFPGMPERDSIPVRLCDFKIFATIEWVQTVPSGEGVILWYYHQDVGEWLAEEMEKTGIPYLYCPAGNQYNIAIADPLNEHKVIIASITAHGTGKNLQAFQHQRFVQFPRQADQAEQTLGRTHRNGQKADELIVVTSNTTEFDHQNFGACLNDALYLHQTIGSKQKLIYASYDPAPRIFPSDFLRERGFQNQALTALEQRALNEKFGIGL